MVTKTFRFNNKNKYCDVYITVKISNKKNYIVKLNFTYSDDSKDALKANPLYLEGMDTNELKNDNYKLKCNEFNYGLIDYLLMDFKKLIMYSGYQTAGDYKKELIQFLDIDKYCY